MLYHEVVHERSMLKVQVAAFEKKMERRDDRLAELAKQVEQLRLKDAQWKKIVMNLRNEFVKISQQEGSDTSMRMTDISSGGNTTRVSVRGGGGKQHLTPRKTLA